MKIVVVNGYGGSGKDTFENFVRDYGTAKGYQIYKTSMVEFVKEEAEKLGWQGGKTLADRRFLSDLKDSLTRWNDSPFQAVEHTIQKCEDWNVDLLFIDAREAEDIDRLKTENSNVMTLLVLRQEIGGRPFGNHADDGVLDYQYDWVIENNGSLEDLGAAAEVWFNEIIVEEKLIKLVDQGAFDRN